MKKHIISLCAIVLLSACSTFKQGALNPDDRMPIYMELGKVNVQDVIKRYGPADKFVSHGDYIALSYYYEENYYFLIYGAKKKSETVFEFKNDILINYKTKHPATGQTLLMYPL